MADRITKALQKLDGKQRAIFAKLIEDVLAGQLQGFDIVKLQGREDVFRVRKGAYRIIFRKSTAGSVTILACERRSNTTHRHL